MSPPSIPKDVLDDLCSRFLVNLPMVEREDNVRICFQIEQAHWFYLDFIVAEQKLAGCTNVGLRDFIRLIFHHCDFLQSSAPQVDSIIDQWRGYKSSVPVFGVILLDSSCEYVLLVQGYYAKNSWGFPKGKVNEDEPPPKCAVREVLEETGFDSGPLLDPKVFIVHNVHDSLVQLYVTTDVPMDYPFSPRTRNEIKKIQWFRIRDLPQHTSKAADNPHTAAAGLNANHFRTVAPFVNSIRQFVADRRKTKGKYRGRAPVAPEGPVFSVSTDRDNTPGPCTSSSTSQNQASERTTPSIITKVSRKQKKQAKAALDKDKLEGTLPPTLIPQGQSQMAYTGDVKELELIWGQPMQDVHVWTDFKLDTKKLMEQLFV